MINDSAFMLLSKVTEIQENFLKYSFIEKKKKYIDAVLQMFGADTKFNVSVALEQSYQSDIIYNEAKEPSYDDGQDYPKIENKIPNRFNEYSVSDFKPSLVTTTQPNQSLSPGIDGSDLKMFEDGTLKAYLMFPANYVSDAPPPVIVRWALRYFETNANRIGEGPIVPVVGVPKPWWAVHVLINDNDPDGFLTVFVKVFPTDNANPDRSVVRLRHSKVDGWQLDQQNLRTVEWCLWSQTENSQSYRLLEVGDDQNIARFDFESRVWSKIIVGTQLSLKFFDFRGSDLIATATTRGEESSKTNKAAFIAMDKSNGNLLWTKHLDPFARYIYATPNPNGILLTAGLWEQNKLLFMQLNSDASSILWQKTGPIDTNAGSDEGFCVNGNDPNTMFVSFRAGYGKFVVGKMNTLTGAFDYLKFLDVTPTNIGSETWGTLYKQRAHVSNTGQLTFAFEGISYSRQGQQAFIIRLDVNGNIVFCYEIADVEDNGSFIHSIDFSQDGLFAFVTGYAVGNSPTGEYPPQYLMKIPLDESAFGNYESVNIKAATNVTISNYLGTFSNSTYTISNASIVLNDSPTYTIGEAVAGTAAIQFTPT